MRILILSLIACITCVAAPGYTENLFSDEIWDVLNYRRRLDRGDWLPFEMAFPAHLVVLPVDRNKELGLYPGIYCGERSTIKDLWRQYEEDPNANLNPLSGVFYISLSWDIGQKDSETFSVSDQEISSFLEKQGATSINISTVYWNEFPVKSVEVKFSSCSYTFIAWVGLNTGGEAVKIQYFCPRDESKFVEERAIWNQFLHNSVGLSYEEYTNRLDKIFE